MHGAMLRVTFPSLSAIQAAPDAEKRVCFSDARWISHCTVKDGISYISAETSHAKHDKIPLPNFTLFIQAESEDVEEIDEYEDLLCFRYKRTAKVVTVRIATSLISSEQAKVNLHRELPLSKSFDDLLIEAKSEWNRLLRRVDVVDPGPFTGTTAKHLTAFYTGLARALSFPR
jgi:putative alpha-1,2-mannosidase